MKIKRHTNINATNFEYLSVGTVFKCLDGKDDSLYMRIENIEVKDVYDTRCYTNIINAIDLENGVAMCFSDCTTVMVVDGEFVINE